MKKALITGITGQDGSYLAELLLAKDYEVYGIVRRSSSLKGRIDRHLPRSTCPQCTPAISLWRPQRRQFPQQILRTIKPDEIYNLGAQSHVRVSFDIPEYTAEVTGLGTHPPAGSDPRNRHQTKFYQAPPVKCTARSGDPQRETTPFYPRSPYGAAKVYAYWITVNYREAYGILACNGILFNHESPDAARRSSPARLPVRWRKSSSACKQEAVPGQSRCETRLGIRQGICRGDVADAAGRTSRTIM